MENHQIIDILPTREYTDVAGWIDKPARGLEGADPLRSPRHVGHLRGGLLGHVAQGGPGGRPLPRHRAWPTAASTPSAAGCRPNRPGTAVAETTRSIGPDGSCSWARRSSTKRPPSACASLLALGDPGAEVAIAYRVKERLRDFYRTSDPDEARLILEELEGSLPASGPCPPRSKGSDGRCKTWFDKICNFHLARVSNGPTEALNNLIKRIKRIGFGFRNFENYRIRALLYAGRPNWRVLGSIVVR